MNYVVIFTSSHYTWSYLTISFHKLEIVYGSTKFTPSSTSYQKLKIKISGQYSKALIHEKCSKQKVLK